MKPISAWCVSDNRRASKSKHLRIINSGAVTQISPLGVEKDNVVSFEVRVSIDNASGELRANMSANAEIVLDEHKGALLVPEKAVIYDSSSHPAADPHN